jgi:hypothetical protein
MPITQRNQLAANLQMPTTFRDQLACNYIRRHLVRSDERERAGAGVLSDERERAGAGVRSDERERERHLLPGDWDERLLLH